MNCEEMTLGRFPVFLAIVTVFTGCVGLQGVAPKRGPEYEQEIQSWRRAVEERGGSGMWLVIRSYTNAGNFFAITTNSRFSHAAVLDLDNGKVIESAFGGVVESPLEKLIQNSHRLALVEPKGWTPEKGVEAVAKARSLIGKKFDFCGLIGFPNPNRWYCSEIPLKVWNYPTDRFGPWNVIHPRRLTKIGTVLFDSGTRDGKPDE